MKKWRKNFVLIHLETAFTENLVFYQEIKCGNQYTNPQRKTAWITVFFWKRHVILYIKPKKEREVFL